MVYITPDFRLLLTLMWYTTAMFQVFAMFSLILSAISVLLFCLETVPGVRETNLTIDHFADYHGVETGDIHDSSTYILIYI